MQLEKCTKTDISYINHCHGQELDQCLFSHLSARNRYECGSRLWTVDSLLPR